MTPTAGRSFAGGHPDAEQLARLPDLDPEPDVVDHLASCRRCQGMVDHLQEVRDELADLPPVALPDPVARRVADALRAEPTLGSLPTGLDSDPTPGRRKPATWLVAVAAAAVVLAGGGTLLAALDRSSREQTSSAGPASVAESAAGSAGGRPAQSLAAADPSRPDVQAVLGQARSLLASHHQMRAQGTPPPLDQPSGPGPGRPGGTRAAADPRVQRCLAALGIPSGRLLLAADTAFGGAPATLLLLRNADPRLVDVRVARPGCPAGRSDLRYALDRLPVS